MAAIAGMLQKLTRDDNWIDDTVDRMSRRTIVAVVAVQLLVVYGGGFLRGNPIQCFTPKYFTGQQEKYSENLCWLESTHYIIDPLDQADAVINEGFLNSPIYKTTGPKSGYVGPYTKGKKIAVSYYQWVPIILIIIALFAHLPFLVWKNLANRYSLPLKSIVTAARNMSSVANGGEKTRCGYSEDLIETLVLWLKSSRNVKKSFIYVGQYHGNVHFFAYMYVKFLYILMFLMQLGLLQLFLGVDERFNILHHGSFVVESLVTNFTWPQHPSFPIDTTCVIRAEQQGNPLPYTLQCILPMNLYFDKFFALFTIAFPILIAAFFINTCKWLKAMSKSGRRKFIESHLIKPLGLDGGLLNSEASSTTSSTSSSSSSSSTDVLADLREVAEFHEEFLRRDGVFVLELIKMNVGRFVTEHVLEKLWLRYVDIKREQKIMRSRMTPPPMPPTSTSASSSKDGAGAAAGAVGNEYVDSVLPRPTFPAHRRPTAPYGRSVSVQ